MSQNVATLNNEANGFKRFKCMSIKTCNVLTQRVKTHYQTACFVFVFFSMMFLWFLPLLHWNAERNSDRRYLPGFSCSWLQDFDSLRKLRNADWNVWFLDFWDLPRNIRNGWIFHQPILRFQSIDQQIENHQKCRWQLTVGAPSILAIVWLGFWTVWNREIKQREYVIPRPDKLTWLRSAFYNFYRDCLRQDEFA